MLLIVIYTSCFYLPGLIISPGYNTVIQVYSHPKTASILSCIFYGIGKFYFPLAYL
jgi:hypothetical protein